MKLWTYLKHMWKGPQYAAEIEQYNRTVIQVTEGVNNLQAQLRDQRSRANAAEDDARTLRRRVIDLEAQLVLARQQTIRHIPSVKPGDVVIFVGQAPGHTFGYGWGALHQMQETLSKVAGGPVGVLASEKAELDIAVLRRWDRERLRETLDAAEQGEMVPKFSFPTPEETLEAQAKWEKGVRENLEKTTPAQMAELEELLTETMP